MNSFETKIEVRWSDCDLNRHVRHSAYYDYGAHCRMRFFVHIGYDTEEMMKENLGPVLFKEECTFIKEVKLEDDITITIAKGFITEDGSKWEIHHEIFNEKKEKCAHITVKGAWIDLTKRKLTSPPSKMLAAFDHLPQGSDYEHKRKG